MMLLLASQENVRCMERRNESYILSNILLYIFIQSSRIFETERIDAAKQSDRLFFTMMLTASMEKRNRTATYGVSN